MPVRPREVCHLLRPGPGFHRWVGSHRVLHLPHRWVALGSDRAAQVCRPGRSLPLPRRKVGPVTSTDHPAGWGSQAGGPRRAGTGGQNAGGTWGSARGRGGRFCGEDLGGVFGPGVVRGVAGTQTVGQDPQEFPSQGAHSRGGARCPCQGGPPVGVPIKTQVSQTLDHPKLPAGDASFKRLTRIIVVVGVVRGELVAVLDHLPVHIGARDGHEK